MRIITIARCAMFVSGLFQITEAKIVYVDLNSVADPIRFLISMVSLLDRRDNP